MGEEIQFPFSSGGGFSVTFAVFLAVASGIAAGRWLLPLALYSHLDSITSFALAALVFGVGIDIGRNRSVWQRLRQLGFQILIIPCIIAIGSITGAVLAGMVIRIPYNEASAVGAGFGWYSLSGIILAQIYNVETGALAFLSNVIREIIALVSIPVVAKRGRADCQHCPGAATTMDTTLPLIVRFGGPETAVIAFFSGVILTLAVPILVPLFINL
jgi:uncharacterized membrane protein YbjE (DUF340 family)